MARIILPTSPLVSKQFLVELQTTIELRDTLQRTKNIMDEITGGGITPAALETSTEVVGSAAALQAGQGAILYNAVVVLLAAVSAAGITSIIKQFDQG
jgi:hypothetical protein